MTVIYSIISFILILLPLVILHEFGHYFSAKFFKIKVLEFGFGFPPKLFSFWSSKKLIYFEKKIDNLDFIPFRFKDVTNDKYLVFRAILSGITDTVTPEYTSERYVGRPEKAYVYQGTDREISFTFDIYPKSKDELIILWDKLNYLVGMCYPSYAQNDSMGLGMVAPFCELTIGDMFKDTPGYLGATTLTVNDGTTWEIDDYKLPK